jgi:hypothetical protein
MKNKSNVAKISTLVFFIIAFFTNPPVDKHREVIKEKVNLLLQKSLYEKFDGNNSNELGKSLGANLGSMLGSAILDPFINEAITSDSYLLFSTTNLTCGGQTKTIGFGVFGNVFIFDNADKSLKDKFNNTTNSNK